MGKNFTLPSFYLLFMLSGIYLESYAQEICGTDFVHQQMMQNDVGYREKYLQMQKQVDTIIQSGAAQPKGSRAVYNIPVVVHVIHLGEAEGTGTNISVAQIQAAINGLNDRFRNIIGAGLDMEINFCLASRDPNRCITNGINRADGSAIPNYQANGISRSTDTCGGPANEYAVKDLSKWPVANYYNIWVVNKICGGWYGYAYYPWGGTYDGAVMWYNAMTYSLSSLTHEIGHGFNLMHTFEGDGGNVYCPADTNCTLNGDKICDTPPHKQGDCGSTNPCSGTGVWDNTRNNYMSYCFPSTANALFTPNQKTRVTATMQTYPRLNLVTSIGCTPGNVNCLSSIISEKDKFSLAVYPNPAFDVLSISGSDIDNGDYRFMLKNIMGQVVLEQHTKIENNVLQKSFSITELPGGIYFLIIEKEKVKVVMKVNKLNG